MTSVTAPEDIDLFEIGPSAGPAPAVTRRRSPGLPVVLVLLILALIVVVIAHRRPPTPLRTAPPSLPAPITTCADRPDCLTLGTAPDELVRAVQRVVPDATLTGAASVFDQTIPQVDVQQVVFTSPGRAVIVVTEERRSAVSSSAHGGVARVDGRRVGYVQSQRSGWLVSVTTTMTDGLLPALLPPLVTVAMTVPLPA